MIAKIKGVTIACLSAICLPCMLTYGRPHICRMKPLGLQVYVDLWFSKTSPLSSLRNFFVQNGTLVH